MVRPGRERTPELRRRDFLRLSGLGAAGLAAAGGLPLFHFRSQARAAGAEGPRPRIQRWEDLYRRRWTWDRVAKGSHGWLNCRSACNWDLYVKDGVVVREEQSGTYGASEQGLPDFNPRGCQKGACYTNVMYGPSRLTVPLKRAGERGEGRWQPIPWEQAVSEIAEKLLDIAVRDGADAIVHDLGPHFDQGPTTAGRFRFFGLLGASISDDWGEIGDLNLGAALTLGLPHVGGSSDEWFLSDYLVVWMMNPSVTQVPDAHYLHEARYGGSELVVVDPQYTATAMHADQWLPIEPGTDAALALATARHVWETGRVDLGYVREQTDLPLLVRLDTGRFLREEDLEPEGRPDVLYLWDPVAGAPAPAPGCQGDPARPRLDLEGLAPPIEGRFEVTLPGGARVEVAPVGTLVRERLEPFTFEATAARTGLGVEAVRRFAEGFAAAERPMVLSSWGSNRYFHSDQMNRAKLLCLSLRGAIGKRGAGFHSTGWVGMEGFDLAVGGERTGLRSQLAFVEAVGLGTIFRLGLDVVRGRKSMREFEWELTDRAVDESLCATAAASLNHAYQGVREDLDAEQAGLHPRPLSAYVDESHAEGWMPLLPRRSLAHLWPELELIVDVNPKLSFTGMHADYLLPAAGYYEKHGIKYPVAYVPYLHFCDRAVEPLGESKDEWEIFWLLAAEVERRARERGVSRLDGCGKRPVELDRMVEAYSFHGAFGPRDTGEMVDFILDKGSSSRGMSVAGLAETGIARYTGVGPAGHQAHLFNDDWDGEGVLTTLTHFTEGKWRWPTFTGRQQFYVDHPWFLEAGEALPADLPSPAAGGDLPFRLVSCHARWSIHSVWRDDPSLLRLQRGEPVLYLEPGEAGALGIEDGGWCELSNRYGAVRMRVKHSAMVRPGVAFYFHAWEPHQFPEHRSYKFVTPGLMNPLHFAGGEGHLGFRFAGYQPGTHVQDTRVAIRPWTGEDPGGAPG